MMARSQILVHRGGGGGEEQGFQGCFADRLNQSWVSSLAQASEWLNCKIYKHFDLISIVDKSTDSGKLFSIFFYNNIEGFYVHFYWIFSENPARDKDKNKLRHHRVTSMALLSSAIALHQSVSKKSFSYCKM